MTSRRFLEQLSATIGAESPSTTQTELCRIGPVGVAGAVGDSGSTTSSGTTTSSIGPLSPPSLGGLGEIGVVTGPTLLRPPSKALEEKRRGGLTVVRSGLAQGELVAAAELEGWFEHSARCTLAGDE
jgi:hypothetical protein